MGKTGRLRKREREKRENVERGDASATIEPR